MHFSNLDAVALTCRAHFLPGRKIIECILVRATDGPNLDRVSARVAKSQRREGNITKFEFLGTF